MTWIERYSTSNHHDSYDRAEKAWRDAVNAHDGSAKSHRNIADKLANLARLTRHKKTKDAMMDGVREHNELANQAAKSKSFEVGPYPIKCKECGHVDSAQYMRDGKCADGVGCS